MGKGSDSIKIFRDNSLRFGTYQLKNSDHFNEMRLLCPNFSLKSAKNLHLFDVY